MKQYPAGMIGIPCSDSLRTSDLLPSLMRLNRPPNTMFKKENGLGVANPLNVIGKAFMDRSQLQWLFLTNDDNLLPPNAIMDLLARDVDAVTGLYFGRIQPFEPIIFDAMLYDSSKAPQERWYRRHLMTSADHGMIPVVACGDGCLLIKRRVLEAIPYPWWEYGETFPDACDHDMVFTRKIREAGFQIWCDTDVVVDHVCQMVVRPHRNPDGEWRVRLVQGSDTPRSIDLPAAFKEEGPK